MKKKKLDLISLKVQSFVTQSLPDKMETIKGGSTACDTNLNISFCTNCDQSSQWPYVCITQERTGTCCVKI